MQAYHNSWDADFRTPFGAVSTGTEVTLRLRVWDAPPHQALLRTFYRDAERTLAPLSCEGEFYTFRLEKLEEPGLLYYYFELRWEHGRTFYGAVGDGAGGEGCLTDCPQGFQVTISRPQEVPDWLSRGVMYQIYVDRYCSSHGQGMVDYPRPGSLIHACWKDTPFYIRDADGSILRWDFFGGNLRGVISKLDLLCSRGITVLYLNPIFDAPSNHKYDTGDYRRVDPGYGTEEDLRFLVQEAHARGMRVILDGVFSHTGSDSLYFNAYGHYPGVGAAQSPDSPYASWYRFEEYPHTYDCWWGVKNMPCVEEMDPGYLDYMLRDPDSTIRRWMRCGIDGWRLDVADELPDEFLRLLRQVVREENPQAILLGEVWEDASHKVSYGKLRTYFTEPELDAVTNYPFRDAVTGFLLGQRDAAAVRRSMMGLYENYPRAQFLSLMNMTGTHDTLRLMTLLGEAPDPNTLSEREREKYRLPADKEAAARRRVKLYALLQFTHPGLPTVYYGDETGLQGYADPYNRGTYPWGAEDEELVNWFTVLAQLRHGCPALAQGAYLPLAPHPDVYGHLRTLDEDAVVILVNRSANPHQVELKLPVQAAEVHVMHGENEEVRMDAEGRLSLHLEGLSGCILRLAVPADTASEGSPRP